MLNRDGLFFASIHQQSEFQLRTGDSWREVPIALAIIEVTIVCDGGCIASDHYSPNSRFACV